MEDRRRLPRALPDANVEVLIAGNRAARVVDISPEGAQLELVTALKPGRECRLSLPLPGGTVQLRARVTRCRLTSSSPSGATGVMVYRAGVTFLDVEPKLAALIGSTFRTSSAAALRTGPVKVWVKVDEIAGNVRRVN